MNLLLTTPPAAAVPSTASGFRVVTRVEELRALIPAWQELLENSAEPAPTLTPAWLLTWWDVYGEGRRLAVGVWHEGDQLIALAPLCTTRAWHPPGIPLRRLEWLGSDVPADDGVCSDFLNLIVRHGCEARIVDELVERVAGGAFGGWDECVLGRMNGNSPLAIQITERFRRAGYAVETTPQDIAPFLPLGPSWDDYLRGLPKRKRQGLNAALRHLTAWAGEVQIQRAETPDQLEAGMSILADLHRRRWQDEGRGAFSPRFSAFHNRYARYLLDQGDLDLAWLVVRGEPVAATYSFRSGRKTCFYQCGRKLDVPPAVRLGIVMVIFALQRAWTLGLNEFDFLAGHDAYKFEFTDQARPIIAVRVARRGVPELLRRGARFALQACRSARQWLWRAPVSRRNAQENHCVGPVALGK